MDLDYIENILLTFKDLLIIKFSKNYMPIFIPMIQ